MTGSDSDSGHKKCWRKIRPQVVHVVVVEGLTQNIYFLDRQWQQTHKRGWGGGQEDARRRQTEWKLQMKEEQVKPW